MMENLKVVQLLKPSDCVPCRFAKIVSVVRADGTSQQMLNCKRLDCDNWMDVTQDNLVVKMERDAK